jgi:histidyl-tRNA synthetase
MIFQLFIDDKKVGGGGRYDALIPAMSGKNIPASGFGLYLDFLMELIEPKTLSDVTLPKILVIMNTGAAETGFAVAHQLREAGYIVKLYLGGRGPVDTFWKLEVNQQAPRFILTDPIKKMSYYLQSAEEVLEKIGS